MKDPAILSVVLLLPVLTGGCGKEADTPAPSQKPPPAAETATSAAEEEVTFKPTAASAKAIGIKLVEIPAGEFMMGSAPDVSPKEQSQLLVRLTKKEKPQHLVRITKPFYLGATEVTQGQYEKVMGKNPSQFRESGPDAPVTTVSWDDAQEFCRKLSELAEEKEAGRRYRLPTEAQWEYACRAGSTRKWCFGDDESRLGDYAWYDKNSNGETHQVGQKKPNAWGLYDMHGNVREWCADWYDYNSEYYANSPTDDPTGPSAGLLRVNRGGCEHDDAGYCRSAFRLASNPGLRLYYLGFRVALVSVDASAR